MKKIFILGLLVSALSFTAEKEFKAEIGASGFYSNGIYQEKNKGGVIPFLNLSYKNLYMDNTEAGLKFDVGENLSIKAYTNFMDGNLVKGEDLKEGYKTYKKRKTQMAYGGKLSYRTGPVEGYIFAQGGKKGAKGGAGVNYIIPVTEKMAVLTGIKYNIYNKKYTDYYFGVHEDDLGGKLQKTYFSKSSHSYGLQVGIENKITEKFSAVGFFSVERFSKEVHKSPIIKDKNEIRGGLGVKYNF
ncbi:MipA/OmpV family protein [Leptotrichia sp. OH3620_COT-345]|uniref:MipA/OmpV family protein n=1 Tax=Leptotrichia sp. OH3620_COT-345 TaxID=2491048 RepID=UPI000F6549C5|nr:MipA/OmpV family protein [Leptotrichia sp. OH3620_COT-345]RRD39902.1 MipA/OmpV family protein [Leptotrichia sp. OH3620_COT-345]